MICLTVQTFWYILRVWNWRWKCLRYLLFGKSQPIRFAFHYKHHQNRLHRFPLSFSLWMPKFKYHPRKTRSINYYNQRQYLQSTINSFHSKTICISFKSIRFQWLYSRAFILPHESCLAALYKRLCRWNMNS